MASGAAAARRRRVHSVFYSPKREKKVNITSRMPYISSMRRLVKAILLLIVLKLGVIIGACERKPSTGAEENREFRGIAFAPKLSSASADASSQMAPKVSIGAARAPHNRDRDDCGACGCAPGDPLCTCL